MSKFFEDAQEAQYNAMVAAALGLEIEDLESVEWSLTENASDDGMVYSYWITFEKDADKEVLAKVRGLQGRRAEISVSAFDRPEAE